MHLFEYSIIRYVPDIEREEFVNVGLIMMCKRKRWLRVEVVMNHERIVTLCPAAQLEAASEALYMFENIGRGDKTHGPIAALEPEERFRWLTAVKSACLQTSRPHAGLTKNLDATFECLLDRLIK